MAMNAMNAQSPTSPPSVALTVARTVALALAALAGLAAGCRPAQQDAPAATPEALSVTKWTDRTELFAEYPPLVVGQTSRFAIHLTRLDSFAAVSEGTVEVRLQGSGGGAPETFRVDKPSRPGIFGVDVRPTRAGRPQIVIALRAPGLADEHQVGDVEVSPDASAARAAQSSEASSQEPDTPRISFLKEQQWSLEFGTAVVTSRPVRASLRVPAEIVARPGGAAEVLAPIDGRVVSVANVAAGASVRQGQELVRLLPPSASPADLPHLEQARAEARTARDLARRDRERADRLVTAGAAPQRRLDDATAVEQIANTRVEAAERQLALSTAARTGQGTPEGAGLFVLRAPIQGTVAARAATTGANVIAGAALFTLVDADHVHVVGRVAEADAGRAAGVTGGEIQMPARRGALATAPDTLHETLAAGRLVSRGRVIDAASRTLPIVFAFDNRTARLPVGQTVFLRLLFDETAPHPVVPTSAIVDDGGRPVVFVQREGEAFERRAVTLGSAQGDVVQVVDGLEEGERVVTKGAYLVRLASLSTQMPAHGHVH